ncbi:MAG: alkaline phosphatase PhoX [Methylococcaceae bacterium]|jgi:hypothetical protein
MKLKAISLAISATLAASAAQAVDFGARQEQQIKAQSLSLFGLLGTLGNSSSTSLTQAQAQANPANLITVAPGLSVNIVSAAANLGPNIDMMVLYPNNVAPTHIIACNEQGASQVGVQRIRLSDGLIEDIISSGLTSCDPAEITPWGTVVIGEEAGTNGRMFEILDPLTTTGVTVTGSGANTTTSDNTKVRFLPALGQLSFEGISILPNGVALYQDENRPGNGVVGGGYFKFIPSNLFPANGAPISNLDASPLASGRVFGFRAGKRNNSDFGPGNNLGRGNWVEVTDGLFGAPTTTPGVSRNNLRAAAATLSLTTGYRPEDQDIDPKALAAGNVRVCGTNTGDDTPPTQNAGDNNFGTAFCLKDGTLAESAVINTTNQTIAGVTYAINNGAGAAIPEYQTLVENFFDFGMPDNVAYQPGRGNWVINEDGEGPTYSAPRNNDIWDCLDDGTDRDQLADACVKVATLNDLTAETTGGVFNAAGNEYYVSIQHNITGHGVIVKITGWR